VRELYGSAFFVCLTHCSPVHRRICIIRRYYQRRGNKHIAHPGANELQDSDYESNPDPTRHELDAFTAYESDTEISDDSTSSLPGRQEYYSRAGEAL